MPGGGRSGTDAGDRPRRGRRARHRHHRLHDGSGGPGGNSARAAAGIRRGSRRDVPALEGPHRDGGGAPHHRNGPAERVRLHAILRELLFGGVLFRQGAPSAGDERADPARGLHLRRPGGLADRAAGRRRRSLPDAMEHRFGGAQGAVEPTLGRAPAGGVLPGNQPASRRNPNGSTPPAGSRPPGLRPDASRRSGQGGSGCRKA